MKNELNDVVKKKMESLTTLSGGIVFGKEEAWEKLQARLESRPAKKIKLYYWMAAAAVVFLFISIMGTYYFPAKKIAINKRNQAVKLVNNAGISQPQFQQSVLQTAKIGEQRNISIAAKSIRKMNIAKKAVNHASPLINMLPVIAPGPVIEDKQVPAITNSKTLTAKPSIKQMKVVHINDMNDENMAKDILSIAGNQSITDLKKLPVVHINDLNAEVQEKTESRFFLRKENFAVNILLFPADGLVTPYKPDDNYNAINSLKFKLN